jgi:hypothetical protein
MKLSRFVGPRFVSAMALAVMLALAGCAVTPQTRQSLAGYVQAMEQVEASANLLLTGFSSELQAQEAAGGGAGPAAGRPAVPEYPPAFTPHSEPDAARSAPEQAVARTRLALVVVREYNRALVALAQGQSEAEVRARVVEFGGALGSLASLVGTAIPGLGAVTALAPQIVKLAQDAANREQLVRAVEAGRKPVAEVLLDLEAQTSSMYRVSVVATRQAQTAAQNDIRRTAATLAALVARYGPPVDAEVARKAVLMQAALTDIGLRTQTLPALPVPFAFGSGRPAFDAGAAAEGAVFVQALRASAQQHDTLVARQNAYYALLGKYVALLRQTQAALDLVAASLARPIDLGTTVDRLFKTVFELRDSLAAYRHPALAASQP